MTKQEIAAKIEELQGQLDELREAAEKVENTCFSRVDERDRYYTISTLGDVSISIEEGDDIDDIHYATANYCTNQDLMKKRIAEETLSRLIWREAEIANAKCESVYDLRSTIYYNPKRKKIETFTISNASVSGMAVFINTCDANACIENVVAPFVKDHPELGWELADEEEQHETN